MSDPVGFLNAFAHILTVMTLYPEGHRLREQALDVAFEQLGGLAGGSSDRPSFTFMEDEVVYGREPLRELRSWGFGLRLVAAGIQRLEFERQVSREEFEALLEEILARLTLATIDTGEGRQMRSIGARFGTVGLQVPDSAEEAPAGRTTLALSLGDEADTFRRLQSEVQSHGSVQLLEAEAVVRSLSVAMHGDSRFVLPLLKLKEFDQYTTTHSLNVAVLSLGLAEALGFPQKDIRAIGVAGLLHDIGKTRIPIEILTKPGKLTDEERAIINSHPVDGARIIFQSEDDLEMTATVAYEHHVMLNGGGYPSMHYSRPCTIASRLVHVCDVFDALSTKRPYRDAWPTDKTVAYLEERAGLELDPDIVAAFVRTLREGETRVRVLTDEQSS